MNKKQAKPVTISPPSTLIEPLLEDPDFSNKHSAEGLKIVGAIVRAALERAGYHY